MGLEEDFAAAAEDISNNVNKTLSDDELKEVLDFNIFGIR